MDVGIFAIDVELDTGHGHVHEDAVVNLAEGGAIADCFVSPFAGQVRKSRKSGGGAGPTQFHTALP